MRPSPPRIRARFVDGPFAGVLRLIDPHPDGTAPRLVTLPVSDPGLDVSAVAYERIDEPTPDGDPRYRVAPVALRETG